MPDRPTSHELDSAQKSAMGLCGPYPNGGHRRAAIGLFGNIWVTLALAPLLAAALLILILFCWF